MSSVGDFDPVRLKQRRSNAKALVTRRKNELHALVDNNASEMECTAKAEELKLALTAFEDANKACEAYLTESTEEYCNEVQQGVIACLQRANITHDNIPIIRPDDSISQVSQQRADNESLHGSRVSSRVSRASSVTSQRAKAAARKAALMAEAAAMNERQQLALEELALQHKKQNLEMRIDIAKADAEELVYRGMEEDSIVTFNTKKNPSMPAQNIESTFIGEGTTQQQVPINAAQQVPTNAAQPSADTTQWEPLHLFTPAAENRHPLLQALQEGQQQQRQMLSVMQLPKVELQTFDGSPMKYWLFIRAFENSVEKDLIDDNAKLTRLLQYCTGEAKRVIECCAIMSPAEGYSRARQLLKERFGNDYTISESWVQNITQGAPIKSNDRVGLLKYSDELKSCQEVLKAMDKLAEIDNQTNLVRIVERLPLYLQNRWKQEVRKLKERHERRPKFTDIVSFVDKASDEANDPVYGKITDMNKERTQGAKRGHGRVNFNIQRENLDQQNRGSDNKQNGASSGTESCAMCGNGHNLFQCDKFKQARPEDRLKMARDKRLCFNCLSPNHTSVKCRKTTVCTVPGCGRKHTKYLHVQNNPKNEQRSNDRSAEDTSTENVRSQGSVGKDDKTSAYSHADESINEQCNTTGAGIHRVALPITPVKVMTLGGKRSIETYALLDSGSTSTFCSADLVKQLGIKGKKESLSLTTLTSSRCAIETEVISVIVSGVGNDVSQIRLPKVYVRPEMSISMGNAAKQTDIDKWPHLAGIQLPQVDEQKVQLLIGLDASEAIIPIEVKTGPLGAPYATRTRLGWTLNGPLDEVVNPNGRSSAVSNYIHADDDLHRQVEMFWKLDSCESLCDERVGMSVDDERVISVWEKSICKVEGHYQVDIPFKNTPPEFPNNRSVAEQRLQSLGKRFNKDRDLYKEYSRGIQDLLDKGYAEKVPDDELQRNDGKLYYLPHFPVFHERKPGKTRIVFDCAAKYQGKSLNDNVLQGPDLTNTLIGVLLRFRQEPVALIGDVESMFHQVRANPDHCDVLRFLWWPNNDIDQKPEEYRMLVHLFGGVWSPSTCTFALKQTIKDNASDFDETTVETAEGDFYVDDLLASVKSEEEATLLVGNLRELLSRGGFRLTKWMSNSRRVLQSIPEAELAKDVKDKDLYYDTLPTERALGVSWNVESDFFDFNIVKKDKPLTRRGLLSIVSSVYDPLGFACPYVLPAKLIIQELSRKKLGWDEAIPEEQLNQWKRWMWDLPKLQDFKIARCLKPEGFGDITHCQLHNFSDASQGAYGVTTYIRMVNREGKVHCALVMAKCRLAPLKPMTIPRLELAAATLATKMDKAIRKEITLPINESVFWTDSTIVLQYVTNETKRFNTFVANRVAIIRENASPQQFRYVDTKDNPADDTSRGLTAEELLQNERWVHGPTFLRHEETAWPKNPVVRQLASDDPEVKRETKAYMTSSNVTALDSLIQKHSSWHSLKRSIAWLLRLKVLLQNKALRRRNAEVLPEVTGSLTVKELNKAELEIAKYVQGQSFTDEMKILQGNDGSTTPRVKRVSPIVRLDPFINAQGILCVGGRLKNAPSNENMKHQIILPKKHHVVNLIVRHYHQMSGHSGSEYVLSLIRQKYWIVQGRRTVTRVLRDCFQCKRQNAASCGQKMADLPQDRVTPDSPPFTSVGVDYFGPLMVKRGRSLVKRYGCVFTCLAIRSVHIEIAHSLDTDSFINALCRFTSRRGCPERITSDNATNFTGANRELRASIESWNQQKIETYLEQREIQWKFNPPAASHMGGIWERQIRTIRKILTALTKEQTLDDEGLSTLMCQVESIINGRPLTPNSSDSKDDEPLTPNHLLLLRPARVMPPGVFKPDDVYCKRRWRQVQYLSNVFWRRWTKEYLSQLQERQKWWHKDKNLHTGDIVLVMDGNMPRNVWPLARVVECYPGKDGCVRIVRVKTRSNTMLRPIHKLCLLESA